MAAKFMSYANFGPFDDSACNVASGEGQGSVVVTSDFEAHVAEQVRSCRDRIDAARARGGHGQDVVLVAVTKTHGPEAVEAAFRAGIHDIGENKVQEAEAKMSACTVPVRWHLIGHLQRNKARAATRFDLVHSVDSERLAAALDRSAREANKTVDVLMQVNVSGEETKSGVDMNGVQPLADAFHHYESLRLCGVMTMAPFDAEERVLRRVFAGARDACTQLAAAGHPATMLSMGMSGDFEIAVEEGATHVRLGTILFGHRS
jgi:pyridoxal phosphate enzyme (YggS family)